MSLGDPAGAVHDAASTRGQRTVLVVEDDAATREVVSAALHHAGYQVTTATDGYEAADLVHEATPDLIVTEVTATNDDGLTLVEHLRADPDTRAIPLILIGDDHDQTMAADVPGVDDVLPAPIRLDQLLDRVRSAMDRAHDRASGDPESGLLGTRPFMEALAGEIDRVSRGGAPGCLACLDLYELPRLHQQHGSRFTGEIVKQVAAVIRNDTLWLELAGRDGEGRFLLLLPELNADRAAARLQQLANQIVTHTFGFDDEHVRLTPVIGYAPFARGLTAESLYRRAELATDYAGDHLDLHPKRYDPRLERFAAHRRASGPSRGRSLRERLRTPFQIVLTQAMTLAIPFLIYRALAAHGVDLVHPLYALVVVALVLTAYFIWVESFMAIQAMVLPPLPETVDENGMPVPAAFPPASAIIAAYLPNEAATVVETVEAFLRQDYPGDYQVILAYNTPQDLPVEAVLREIAARDRRFIPLRVPGSSSKAQNINAALSLVHGAFVGIFDADHHPQPGSFARAWHWLANGNDVVQGHCVVRNGAESWLTRLVAVEFECIYAVSHPGRARMHNFGIFGGSNGYWKTDLLRQIRMRSFMLTEDIDSSMRATMAGYAITADPNLLSTELAPATPRALWNQRMRWAQGWFQVSLAHLWRCLRSPRLTGRQKLGVLQLLGWREIYPYLANQMFPLLAFCLVHPVKADRVHLLVPLFLLTTVVAVGVGPGQTLVAYLLAAPQVRRHRRWFVTYMIVSALFYTPFKNLIAQVAQVKEIMRERQWKVTPRALPAAAEQEAVA